MEENKLYPFMGVPSDYTYSKKQELPYPKEFKLVKEYSNDTHFVRDFKIVEGEADAKSGEAIGKFNHSNGIHHSRFMNFDNEIKLRIGAAEAFQRGEKSWAENFFWVSVDEHGMFIELRCHFPEAEVAEGDAQFYSAIHRLSQTEKFQR